MSERFDVVNNTAEHRFEIQHGDARAQLVYEMRGSDTIDLVHTAVPASLEGDGYGSALARAALEYARANGLRVIPTCAFVQAYVRRHPEYAELTTASA